MIPNRRDYKLSIAIPSSIVSEAPPLKAKTIVIGQVARLAAIHRVEDIYIYRDSPDESRLIRLILSYIETPQYLRKNLFRMMEELKFVGILPPLRTPHHPLERNLSNLDEGEFREGVVLSEENGEYLIEIGVETPVRVTGRGPSIGGRTTVCIIRVQPILLGKFAKRKDVNSYWGFGIHIIGGGLGKLASREDFDLTLATSNLAPPFRDLEPEFRARLSDAKSVLIAFSSPREGLQEILSREKLEVGKVFDFTANVIPEQGSANVRTEEVLSAALALIGMLR
jgi:predicted SPOUT superfamily RNA methylase MTH1